MIRSLTGAGLALALAGCAAYGTSGATRGARTVDASYAEGGGVFASGAQLTVRALTFEDAGKVGVCAAWAGDGIDSTSQLYTDFVLETGVLRLAGKNLMQGFDDFPEAPARAALHGAPAGCVRTGADWSPGYAGVAPRITFARMNLGADVEDGMDTYFRPR